MGWQRSYKTHKTYVSWDMARQIFGCTIQLGINWILILEQIFNLFNLITNIWAHSSSLLEQDRHTALCKRRSRRRP